MATTNSLGKTSTIEAYVDGGDSINMTYPKLSLNDIFGEVTEFPAFNVYDDYIDELKALAKTIDLSDEEYIKYYQAPKLLANDIYRNSELDFMIMRLNGIYDPKDFTSRHLFLLTADDMNQSLSKIYRANKQLIAVYNENNPTY